MPHNGNSLHANYDANYAYARRDLSAAAGKFPPWGLVLET
jgi:hypothetical protein